MDPLEILDQPHILAFVFHPRKAPEGSSSLGRDLMVEVEEGVRIGCRLYERGKDLPTIIYFHGNGEIAADYDGIAPLYLERGMNLLVTDYRGYGRSDGTPTLRLILGDAHILFRELRGTLIEEGFSPDLFVMGRSLGSLCAIEVARDHQEELRGLIIESGSATNFRWLLSQLGLLPFDHPIWQEGKGFFNREKIRQISIPTLIIHAERDSLIPLDEAKLLYESSGASRRELLIIPGADHNDLMWVGRERYFSRLADFVHSLRS